MTNPHAIKVEIDGIRYVPENTTEPLKPNQPDRFYWNGPPVQLTAVELAVVNSIIDDIEKLEYGKMSRPVRAYLDKLIDKYKALRK